MIVPSMNVATLHGNDTADDARSALLIVGASARAAAFSAIRAGLTPWTADLFADRDLASACQICVRVADYPRGFLEVGRQNLAGPWMYTGALENFPGFVQAMSRRRPLWGNPAAVLRRVRCPFTVARVLQEHGVACPAVLNRTATPTTGRWLRKPKAGASGRGIAFADTHDVLSAATYLQEHIEGEAHSAAYVAVDGQAKLLGMTRQLVGEPWLHAGPFHYCGSVGPVAMSAMLGDALGRLGQVLTTAFELRGLFGMDFILRDGIPWPVEINPRYTASVEVLEWTTGQAAISLHAQAFGQQAATTNAVTVAGLLGKAVYYAPCPLRFPMDGPWEVCLRQVWDPWRVPDYADIPSPGETFDAGQPVLTFFAAGDTTTACRDSLQRIAGDLDRQLFSR